MTLDLTGNSIREIPETYFVGCEKLQYVFFSQNKLSFMPEFTPVANTLLELRLDYNFLKVFGSLAGMFSALTKLNLSHNGISDINVLSCELLTYRWLSIEAVAVDNNR